MKVRNEVEPAVRAEIERVKPRSSGENAACWCSFCEADVTALAMSGLSPHYCTTYCRRSPYEGERPEVVKNAVSSAMRRVRKAPRHDITYSNSHPTTAEIINYNFREGMAQVQGLVEGSDTPCQCEACQADILAYSLNRYPPKYGVLRGRTEILPFQRTLIRNELGRIIKHAVRVVASHPRHS